MARSKTQAAETRRQTRTRPGFWRRLGWLLSGPLGVVLLIVALAWFVSLDVEDLERRPHGSNTNPAITLLDRHGETLAVIGRRYGDYLSLEEIAPALRDAVVAAEDQRFWSHPGLDPIGIARALVRNLQAGRVVEGGSTISQQLAKLMFLTPERSLVRKAKEALYTVWLEARFDKREILEAYLNRVYLGAGAYGVAAAAERYFDRTAAELTLAQSAMLAGLIRAPSRYAPTRDLDLAQSRASTVLDQMAEVGFIRETEAEAAKAAPATVAAPALRADTGYFADWAVTESRLYAGEGRDHLRVQTTLDPDIQSGAEDAVDAIFDAVDPGERPDQTALVAMTNDGRIRAMLGGRGYAESQFNRATQATRQPGSAFKLFVYLAALESGWRPSDVVEGTSIDVDGWAPRNFDDRYPDLVTVTDSFARSINTAAVRLAEDVGRQRVIEVAERLGITTELRSHPSLALGTSEVNLLELTAAYATVAAGGRLIWPAGIEVVRTNDGDLLYRRRSIDEPVLEPGTVRAMTAMLETTMSRGTGSRADLRRFVAGKTGTSADYRDAWFVGFTDEVVVGIWVGNDDGRPMNGITGGGMPARIFREFILRAYGDDAFEPLPPPPKPGRGEFPVAAMKDVIGEVVDSAFDRLADAFGRLFGG